MRTTRLLPSNLRLFAQFLLLGFFLTPVMAVGQIPDFAETLRLAQEGNAAAQYNLGLMYDNGEGVPEDDVTAYAWFNVAAVSGDENAISARSIIEKQMTPSQISEAQKLSTEIFERIQQGN
jgi:TPR repeat protein